MPLHFLSPPAGPEELLPVVMLGFKNLGVEITERDDGDTWAELVRVSDAPRFTSLLHSLPDEHLLAPALSEAVGEPVLALSYDADGDFEDGNSVHVARDGRLIASSLGWVVDAETARAMNACFGGEVQAGDDLDAVSDKLGIHFIAGREGYSEAAMPFDLPDVGNVQAVLESMGDRYGKQVRERAARTVEVRSFGLRSTASTKAGALRDGLEWHRAQRQRREQFYRR